MVEHNSFKREKKKSNTERPTVGVISGDGACLQSAVRHWTGRPATSVLQGDISVVRLSNKNEDRDIVFLFDPMRHLNPWPVGPFIWLFPERGPSELELAQMRHALDIHAAAHPKLHVVLCCPDHVSSEEAAVDVESIVETLCWALNPQLEIHIEAV